MAIGKVNAYASVTAPQVDFGAIALNAQKFQQAADDERLKMAMTLATQKPKEIKGLDVKVQTTGHSGFDNIGARTLAKYQTEFYNATKSGNIELANNIEQQAYLLTSQMGKMKESFGAYEKALSENKISDASQLYTFGINAVLNGKYDTEEVDGEIRLIPYQTRADGELILDANNKPQPLEWTNAYGETKKYFTMNDINNWNAMIVPNTDFEKDVIPKLSKTVSLDSMKIEDGKITTSETTLTPEKQDIILDKTQRLLIEDRNTMINASRRYFPDEFKTAKKEYSQDDYKKVADAMAQDIFPIYKENYSRTEDEAKQVYLRNTSKSKIPRLSTDPVISKDIKIVVGKEQRKTNVTAWTVSGEKGNNPDKLTNALGYTKDGLPIITYTQKGSVGMGTGSAGVSTKDGVSTIGGKTIIIGGEDSTTAIAQLIGTQYFENGKTKTIESAVDVANYIYRGAEKNGENSALLNKIKIEIKNNMGLVYNPRTNSFQSIKNQ
jgi:hypothetical protein